VLVRREQTPVALLTVHSLKGRRALPFYDLQNGWVPRRGRVTTARHSCPDVPIFGLFLILHKAFDSTFFQTVRKSGIAMQKIHDFGS